MEQLLPGCSQEQGHACECLPEQNFLADTNIYWDLFPEEHFHVVQWRPQPGRGRAFEESMTRCSHFPRFGRHWLSSAQWGLPWRAEHLLPSPSPWRAPQCPWQPVPPPNHPRGCTSSELRGGRHLTGQGTWWMLNRSSLPAAKARHATYLIQSLKSKSNNSNSFFFPPFTPKVIIWPPYAK